MATGKSMDQIVKNDYNDDETINIVKAIWKVFKGFFIVDWRRISSVSNVSHLKKQLKAAEAEVLD